MSDVGTVDPNTDPVLTPPPDPPADDPPADPPPAPEPQPRTIPLETFTREVTPLRAKVRDLELAREEDNRKLRAANELLQRLQRNGNDPNAPPARDPVPQPRPANDPNEVEMRAMQLNFERDARQIISSGLGTYGQQSWQDAVNILDSFGMNNAEFVSSVMDVAGRDKAHEVVYAMAQDPSSVAGLRNMSPARRAVEISRIADKMNGKAATPPPAAPAPPARTVSKAPPPPPPLQPNASKAVDWRTDKASDDEFSRGWNERYVKGGGIRR
jgi:hypothetical protein